MNFVMMVHNFKKEYNMWHVKFVIINKNHNK